MVAQELRELGGQRTKWRGGLGVCSGARRSTLTPDRAVEDRLLVAEDYVDDL